MRDYSLMSAVGPKWTFQCRRSMSAIGSKADIDQPLLHTSSVDFYEYTQSKQASLVRDQKKSSVIIKGHSSGSARCSARSSAFSSASSHCSRV